MNDLFLMFGECLLLGCGVVVSVAALGFTVACLPRLVLRRRNRALASNG